MNNVLLGIARRAWLLAAALAITLVTPTPAAYGGDGDAKLAKLDAAVNRWKKLKYNYKIVTKDASDEKTTIKLTVWMRQRKTHVQQYLEIYEPADMNGTKVLTKSPKEMYIYLPQYKKIRRIASHMTEQGFLGTALSQRDMTLTRYAKYYRATVVSEEGNKLVLSLTEKDGVNAPYPKLQVTVNTSRWTPKEIRYFNADGKHIKTETRTKYRCKKNHCVPKKMKMVDHTKNLTSVLRLTKFTVNPKVKGALFSKRSLK